MPFAIGLVVFTALAKIIRKLNGVRRSFIPFAFSFYAYSAHWWIDTTGSLQAAVDEMPTGYSDKMLPVISNIPMLMIMLVLVIPVAIMGIRLAEKVIKNKLET